MLDEILDQGLTRESLLYIVAYIFALFCALIFHEVAHGLVALWNGDDTAKLSGRLSLNPRKHFDFIGFLCLLLFKFGWAKPVPVNPYKYKNRRLGAITVAIAGVTVNLILAFVFYPLYVLSAVNLNLAESLSGSYYWWYFAYNFCLVMVSLNLSLMLFNLLPLYPLDGYRLITGLTSEDTGYANFARKYSWYIIVIFVLLDNARYFSILSPLSWYLQHGVNFFAELFYKFWGLIL